MLSRALLVLVVTCSVISCNDPLEEKGTRDPKPFTPDLEEKVTASVSGFVLDESNSPVVFAAVTAGGKKVLTDAYGFFSIPGAQLSKFAAQVDVMAAGFFSGYETFAPTPGSESHVRITLLEKPDAVTIDAAAGGTVTTDGASIQLQPNSVVVAATGGAYSGEVNIHARMLHPDEAGLQPGLPGDARGMDRNGYAKTLKSFSPIVVELSTAGGQPLQLAPGKPATLVMPIAAALANDAPDNIPLWMYNTITGLWEEQGVAEKNGDAYTGIVTHFSFWDGATGVPMITVTARIVNSSNQPLAHVPVRITLAGQPLNAGHGRSGFTDANGVITGAVFSNRDFVLDILTPCATSAYAHTFSAAATDLDLGTLAGNLGQSSVVISGRAEDCTGQGIVNGYVQAYNDGFFHRIPIVNGDFTFSGIMCTNTTVSLVAVNLATYKQNTPQEVTLIAGANNLGTLSVCGVSTMGQITYTYDGTTTTIQEPADTIAAYSLDGFNGTQIITLSGDPNLNQKIAFQLTGNEAVGTNTVTEVFSSAFPSGRGFWPANITVTISEYCPPGGFIAGEFSSNMLDFGDNSVHTFACSFRVRRYR
jgi:hypothetical protein